MDFMCYKVSVIIPVYGVEKYVRKCVESLFNQTLSDVEYIFVNDATKDSSTEIIEEVAKRFPLRDIKILHHPENRGLPAARNTGLSAASGKYIFHCDSDDFVEPDMLEMMYKKAEETDAEIVWCDWYLDSSLSSRYMKQPDYATANDAIIGMLNGVMKYNVWNKLVSRSLYTKNSVGFPEGYGMGEDMTMIKLFCNANKVAYCNKAFYHYINTNEQSFSNVYSDRHLEQVLVNVRSLIEYIKNICGNKYDINLENFKLEVKFPFLISDKESQHSRWKRVFPESNKYAGANPDMSMRRKMLQMMAAKNQWWYVKSYYFLLYKALPRLRAIVVR